MHTKNTVILRVNIMYSKAIFTFSIDPIPETLQKFLLCMCNFCSDHLQPMSLCLCRSIHLLDKSSHNDSLPIDSVLFLHNLTINESNLMRFLQVTLFKNTLNTLFKKAKNSTLIFSQTNFDYHLQNTEPGNQQV